MMAELDDPADDARAEAGAAANAAFGADERVDQDYLEVPDAEAPSAKPFNPASTHKNEVYNMMTGRWEKGAVLLQTSDVDDIDEQEQQANDQSDDSDDEEASDDSED